MKKTEHLLPKSFYERDTELVARDLLGKKIIRVIDKIRLSGIIVESEAYTHDDPACHAFRGQTKANTALFGPVGHAYVYFIYGMHYCFNVVARSCQQEAGGVLIRAVQPLEGIEVMHRNRKVTDIVQLTNGPAKVAKAFAIDKGLTGINLMQPGPLCVAASDIEIPASLIALSPRIGISKAVEMHRRFFIKNNQWVSKRGFV